MARCCIRPTVMRSLLLLALLPILWLPVAAAEPNVGTGPNSFEAWSGSVQQSSADQSPAGRGSSAAQEAGAPSKRGFVSASSYAWRNPCGGNLNGAETSCPVNNCPPGQEIYRLWQLTPPPARPLGLVCSGDGPPPAATAAVAVAAPPQVTGAMVLAAFRRIPLPLLVSRSQPADKTLINFDTIFYTRAEPLSRQLTLLGQRVRLEITPSRFRWEYGDGTSDTTTTAGAPYPAKDVTHRYSDARRTVQHRVTVTWTAQWSLNGGPLQPVDGTVATTGPPTPLRVAEASPALSGSGH